jgi:hypothetical protein
VMSSDMSRFIVRTMSRARPMVPRGLSSVPGLLSSPAADTHRDALETDAEARAKARAPEMSASRDEVTADSVKGNVFSAIPVTKPPGVMGNDLAMGSSGVRRFTLCRQMLNSLRITQRKAPAPEPTPTETNSMDLGPITVELAIADTRRLMKEGFSVVTVEGTGLKSVWNFLFKTARESICFKKSMREITVLYPEGKVAEDVLEDIALHYETVRYVIAAADTQKCRAQN